jgi:hypothetical protein
MNSFSPIATYRNKPETTNPGKQLIPGKTKGE